MTHSATPYTELPPLVGEAPAFRAVLAQVSQLAPLDRPVLVVGERGTGKELIAARLTYLSPRWDRPFLTVNCAALAESLLDSELFGHEAGAFTGAVRRRASRFELADGGTLFLDEIAADSDLPALAEAGRFRSDLLDRLAFDVVTVPPLRARAEDIPLLAEHFARAMTRTLGRDAFAGFSRGAMARLQAHSWPGNVRELKNAVERSLYRAANPGTPLDEIVLDPFASPFRPLPPPASAPPEPPEPGDFRSRADRFEVEMLRAALAEHDFNQRRTAEALGLGYHQLRHYLRKHAIAPHPLRAAASG